MSINNDQYAFLHMRFLKLNKSNDIWFDFKFGLKVVRDDQMLWILFC